MQRPCYQSKALLQCKRIVKDINTSLACINDTQCEQLTMQTITTVLYLNMLQRFCSMQTLAFIEHSGSHNLKILHAITSSTWYLIAAIAMLATH